MPKADTFLIELDIAEAFLLHDALLYYAEWSSDELHERKAQRAADMRRKLLCAVVDESGAAPGARVPG